MSVRKTAETSITVAYGDGIGPEIMEATLHVLEEAGANLSIHEVAIGQDVYKQGNPTGVTDDAWEAIQNHKILLKAPITTLQGHGVRSLNVTIRKTMGLYANVRPFHSYDPIISTAHPHVDLVIIRENEEDVYNGVEHQQTHDTVQCLKFTSRPGCERIIRYAFQYAENHNRKKVSCFTKDNIMKRTDGLFHKIFDEIAEEYPSIETDHWIIDIGAARVATRPENFDVCVLPNLYGDIISDIVAEVTGSMGLCPSANIGQNIAMFEAIHGSAPDIAGQDKANPSGLILSSIMMLERIGKPEIGTKIHNAWLKTIEDGLITADLYPMAQKNAKSLGCRDFTKALIERLGETPKVLKHSIQPSKKVTLTQHTKTLAKPQPKTLVGVDIFLDWKGTKSDTLATQLQKASQDIAKLVLITNRGTSVWPQQFPETVCQNHWCTRFVPLDNHPSNILRPEDILKLLEHVHKHGFEFIKTENLYYFGSQPGFSDSDVAFPVNPITAKGYTEEPSPSSLQQPLKS